MPLEGVVLDERLAERGSEAQQAEWDTIIRELLANASNSGGEAATLRIRLAERGFLLQLVGAEGEELGAVIIEHEQLSDHIDE